MPLKFRVLSAIAALLILSLLEGAAVLWVHAHSLFDLEVRTAFNGAAQSVRDTLRSDVEHTVTLREVVSSFQGQRHVRAALCHTPTEARLTRLHNDANVLCLGARTIGVEVAKDCVAAFFTTEFEGGRHARRVAMLG